MKLAARRTDVHSEVFFRTFVKPSLIAFDLFFRPRSILEDHLPCFLAVHSHHHFSHVDAGNISLFKTISRTRATTFITALEYRKFSLRRCRQCLLKSVAVASPIQRDVVTRDFRAPSSLITYAVNARTSFDARITPLQLRGVGRLSAWAEMHITTYARWSSHL